MPALQGMPPQLSQLTNLQTLTNFVVGKGENVIDVEDARKTDLISKEGLNALHLEWSDKKENDEGVLDMSQPHGNLEELTIKGYGGMKFSTWVGDPLFSNTVLVRLENCKNCGFLPPLGQLLFLKELYVSGMPGVESVGHEFYGNGSFSFPRLETLEFEDMQRWKDWFPCQGDQGIEVFSSLKRLSINRCLKLEGSLPENIGSIEKLEIIQCDKLVASIAGYKQLSTLRVQECKGVVCGIRVDLEQLKAITLAYVPEFRFQTKGFMTGLRKVEKLTIAEYSKLQQLHQLASLQTLYMYKCQSHLVLKEEEEEIEGSSLSSSHCRRKEEASCLETMAIVDCPSITSFSSKGQLSLPALKHLEGLSSNLTHLTIWKPYNCKPLSHWGLTLNRLTSLKELWLSGVDLRLSSFPPEGEEMLLPKSLIILNISDFPNLRHPSSQGYRFLTSLESLEIRDCPKLEYFPEDLALSLTQLRIYDHCPVLRKRYKPGNAKDWAIIAHIPYIDIGDLPLEQ
ncbi:putative disease resistance protein RGA1 [Malus domestica]|uniref:putative disease resistance protein RGA1 n=1 Tax=Malus domestica TaxID=3750 RepID=UPI0004992166|nr:putative disease resistance protein RGA1 [Malus domestica]